MQALSQEDRVLQELAKIVFGNGHAAGKLKAIELLGKHIRLFTPKDVLEVDRRGEKIGTDIYKGLAALFE